MDSEDMPNWDATAVDRMLRLAEALQEGKYDEEFDKLFPPDAVTDQPADQ